MTTLYVLVVATCLNAPGGTLTDCKDTPSGGVLYNDECKVAAAEVVKLNDEKWSYYPLCLSLYDYGEIYNGPPGFPGLYGDPAA